MRYHLCCGPKLKQGWVNVDRVSFGQEVVADINKEWKFAKPNSAEYILIEDGLEHVDSLEHFLKNVSRVLTTNGTIEIQVPHFKNPIANLLPKYWERFAYVSGLRIWMKKRGTANDAYS